MAKGIEDTAYYRYARFVALNEVGGDPAEFGIATDEFHRLQQARLRDQPESMTGLSTHDTKRGEDVRARLAVLAEVPEPWSRFAERFLAASDIPSRPFAYFLAQTLVGTGPIEPDRMHAYAEKAMREASAGTTWTHPDAAFEAAVHAAVDRAYTDHDLRWSWDELVRLVTPAGWTNALGQKIVQLTMPGIPDVYQGTELWDDSLVDPDNRRPVDYAVRRSLLARIEDALPQVDASGAAKLLVTSRALRARRDRPELFGDYRPVSATGARADHLVAFDRGGAVTLATRLPVGLAAAGGWGDTTVDLPGRFRDALTGELWERIGAGRRGPGRPSGGPATDRPTPDRGRTAPYRGDMSAPRETATYTHGHHESVLRSHTWRTAENSAAYLLPALRPGMSLLDVGCGPGTITADLAERVAPGRVVAVDQAPVIVRRAQDYAAERGLDLDFAVADVHALQFADDTFDVVHAHQVLQHVGDPVQALREMRRVCKPGGIVAARDSDYAAMTWFPLTPGLDQWLDLYHRVARAAGGEPDAGRRLRSWARRPASPPSPPRPEPGATPPPRSAPGGASSGPTGRRTRPTPSQATAGGHATAEELAAIAEAWRTWGASDDAWFAVLHGEILATA